MPYSGGELSVPDISLNELVWKKLQEYGNRTAVVDACNGGKSMTYMEVYDLSKKVAAYLQSLGIKKGDYISICASGGLEWAYLTFGIIGAGAVVAPCNPSYRENEIMQQFSISCPRMVFVDEAVVGRMASVQKELSSLEKIFVIGQSANYTTLDQILSKAISENLKEVEIDPDNDIVFAPHSSGTTGLPKCVLMTHRNYVAGVMIGASMPRSPNQVSYVDRPMYHAGGFGSLILNIATGVKTITHQESSLETFFRNIQEYRVTASVCVPPTLVEMANTTSNEKYDLSSLNMIIAGGAALATGVIRQIIKKYRVTFVAGYAMSECALISTGIVRDDETRDLPGKIGAGLTVKITKVDTGEECAAGEAGEIRIRGYQVTKGYLKNPEANVVAFDEEGWFRTGDIGYVDEHEQLCVVDRLKEIIKYKTVQVSPAELESVILRHPKVADVGVVGIPDASCGELPKAFVVSSDPSLTAEDVHKLVNDNLVEYKHLRGGVEFVESIPKSATGKIQRNLLKKMAGY